jgi:hypothetical protein
MLRKIIGSGETPETPKKSNFQFNFF